MWALVKTVTRNPWSIKDANFLITWSTISFYKRSHELSRKCWLCKWRIQTTTARALAAETRCDLPVCTDRSASTAAKYEPMPSRLNSLIRLGLVLQILRVIPVCTDISTDNSANIYSPYIRFSLMLGLGLVKPSTSTEAHETDHDHEWSGMTLTSIRDVHIRYPAASSVSKCEFIACSFCELYHFSTARSIHNCSNWS